MKNTIEEFYRAFANLDAEAMAACYHKDIKFEDPAFGILKGEKAGNMWRMLCHSQKGKDFIVKVSDIEYKDQQGKARWQAWYTFSRTGRKVHNIIHAEFKFKDGKIIEHTDTFNLYRWAKQAMGFSGHIIGSTRFFKKKLNIKTNKLLLEFEKNMVN